MAVISAVLPAEYSPMMANLPVLLLPGIDSPVKDAFDALGKGPLLALWGKC